MRVLILGGTGFIGRHAALALRDAGHRVSVLARGGPRDALPADVERLQGDRDQGAAGLQALNGRTWDACVDCSGWTPRQLQPAVERLAPVLRRYVYLSAVRVYGDAPPRPVRETAPRLPPAAADVDTVDNASYGPLKVACEDLLQQAFGARATLLRPQVVTGPHDPSGRFAWWLQRAARGGPMLAPGDGSDALQAIDVRDVARFVVTAIEDGLPGAWNLSGHRITWARFFALLGVHAPVWVPAALLRAEGLGFRELPLFRPAGGPFSALMDVCNRKACAAGLRPREFVSTLLDLQAAGVEVPADLGLSAAREAALIAAARRHRSA